jgi:hypothetical protein
MSIIEVILTLVFGVLSVLQALLLASLKRRGEEWGTISARLDRLPDLAAIEQLLAEVRAAVELRLRTELEEHAQANRLRLGLGQAIQTQKLDAYNSLVEDSYQLYRSLVRILSGTDQFRQFMEKQEGFHQYLNHRAILMSRDVRRAAALIVSITTEVRPDMTASELHELQERTRVVWDLLRIEISLELTRLGFVTDIPSRDELDAWVGQDRNAAGLEQELREKRAALTALTQPHMLAAQQSARSSE